MPKAVRGRTMRTLLSLAGLTGVTFAFLAFLECGVEHAYTLAGVFLFLALTATYLIGVAAVVLHLLAEWTEIPSRLLDFWRLRGQRILGCYTTASVVLMNTVVLFVALNVACWFAERLVWGKRAARQTGTRNPVHEKYRVDLLPVYPGYTLEQIDQLVTETWERPYVYEPFTQMKEAPFSGEYVNVSEAGFRLTEDQGAWPLADDAYNIFLFGGSTVFGYGVADHDTLASFLQKALRVRTGQKVCVYNWGRGFYYSSQETVLCMRLLSSGAVPDLAIFVDGLNEFCCTTDRPAYSMELSEVIDGTHKKRVERRVQRELLAKDVRNLAADFIPIYGIFWHLTASYRDPFRKSPETTKVTHTRPAPHRDRETEVAAVFSRYLDNKTLAERVCAAYGVKAVFVWQPVPVYKYDRSDHLFPVNPPHSGTGGAYALVASRVANDWPGENFVWAADIQEGVHEPLYVDPVHYTGRMCRRLAEYVADALVRQGVLSHDGRPRRGPRVPGD